MLIYLLPLAGYSQQTDNRRFIKISTASDTVVLDSLSVVPGSFRLANAKGIPFPTELYHLDEDASLLLFHRAKFEQFKIFNTQQLTAYFRVFPYNFSKPVFHKNPALLTRSREGEFNPFSLQYEPKSNANDLFSLQGLQKNGSISRGITVGNTQDVVVNSSLNLQLSGKISENVSLSAVITDNNVPVQPEGNTQQLQDFDQVYIQLNDAEKWKVTAGDFQLAKPNSYFMSFYKRAQGLSIQSKTDLRNKLEKNRLGLTRTLEVTASGAISRGKFRRQLLQGIEGNQGPYQLTGNDNELFIIILSGTERVFIDGQLLTRGQTNDYIIDYNTASIRFTPKNLITKDRRIIVEFQYSDRNYSRTLAHIGSDFTQNKLKLSVNFYTEQDSKNQPVQQTIDDNARNVMRNIGDSIQLALAPAAEVVAFSPSEVLYQKTDTTVIFLNGISFTDSVFVYSTDTAKAKFRLRFSDVGQGRGNYLQSTNTNANGRVFYWISPDSLGNKQGRYEPVQLLVTPKKTQMLDVLAAYKMSKNSQLSVEAAVSNYDVNTFSSLNNDDNTGLATKLMYNHDFPLGKKDSAAFTLKTGANLEITDKNFRPIERFRTVEFERDWNLSNANSFTNQFISGLYGGLAYRQRGELGYQLKNFVNEGIFNAWQHLGMAKYKHKGLLIDFNGSYIRSSGVKVNNVFGRYIGTVSQTIGSIMFGIRDELEDNRFRVPGGDSLSATSYYFNDRTFFVSSPDTAKTRVGISYRRRMDKRPVNEELKPADLSHNLNFFVELMKHPNQSFKFNSTLRRLTILDSAISRSDSLTKSQRNFDNMVNRVEYSFKLWKGVVQSTTFYETGSGLELQRQFQYAKVAPGLGQFVWRDYNSDGVQQLNEFENAVFANEAEYIRVAIPSITYVKTLANQFNQTLNINPAIAWTNTKGIRKALARFATQTTFSTDRKTARDDFFSSLNPFETGIGDTNLRSINSVFRNTLFFNRSSSKIGLDYNVQLSNNKLLLINGFESRSNFFHQVGSRWNITRKYTLNFTWKTGNKQVKQDFLSGNAFNLDYYEIEPKFTWQPGAVFRWSVSYRYGDKSNKSEVAEFARVHNAGTEIKYSVVNKGNLTVQVNVVSIAFNGNANSSLGYEMLEALQPGTNYVWQSGWQTNLGKNMQLTLSYNGRKSRDSKAVHNGNIQVRAFF